MRGAFASPVLSSALDGIGDGRDRSLLTDLVYGTLRHLTFVDAALAQRLERPEALPEWTRLALRAAGFELLIRGTPAHAAVSEWVEVVKMRDPRMAGLANAVLRRLEAPRDAPWHVQASLPAWLAAEFDRSLGEGARAAATAMLEPAPLWLALYGGDALRSLEEEGCRVEPGPLPGVVAARSPLPLSRLGAYRAGLVQPQNPSSRLPAQALGDVGGRRVLDLCSGNGIKSAQLAAAGAHVTAVELDDGKTRRAERNLERMGLAVEHLVHDLRELPPLEPAARVLLDAPCSGTGTLRAHPEIKLRLEPDDVRQLSDLQHELLRTASGLTAPGGRLVYSVCSLLEQEGRQRIRHFLADNPDFGVVEYGAPLPSIASDEGAIVLPLGGCDGFFVAVLERSSG